MLVSVWTVEDMELVDCWCCCCRLAAFLLCAVERRVNWDSRSLGSDEFADRSAAARSLATGCEFLTTTSEGSEPATAASPTGRSDLMVSADRAAGREALLCRYSRHPGGWSIQSRRCNHTVEAMWCNNQFAVGIERQRESVQHPIRMCAALRIASSAQELVTPRDRRWRRARQWVARRAGRASRLGRNNSRRADTRSSSFSASVPPG